MENYVIAEYTQLENWYMQTKITNGLDSPGTTSKIKNGRRIGEKNTQDSTGQDGRHDGVIETPPIFWGGGGTCADIPGSKL